jgi:hypothetical protein
MLGADDGFGRGKNVDRKCRATTANGRPAVAMYLRRPWSSTYQSLTKDVLRIENGMIAEITTFDSSVLGWFGLPRELEGGG